MKVSAIERVLLERGYTIASFGRAHHNISVHCLYVAKMRNSNLSPKTLRKIADALGITFQDLMAEDFVSQQQAAKKLLIEFRTITRSLVDILGPLVETINRFGGGRRPAGAAVSPAAEPSTNSTPKTKGAK